MLRILVAATVLTTASPPARGASEPLPKIGVSADAKYADKPAEAPRLYREGCHKVSAWLPSLAELTPDRIGDRGDLVDGNGAKTQAYLDRVFSLFDGLPTLRVVGNHCLSAGLP